MDINQKLELIKKNTAEVITEEELVNLLKLGIPLKHYIGFEISGYIHLGTGLMCMGKVKDFQDAGVNCSVLLADWHTWINDKLGGDLETIKKIAGGYFKEGLKASIECLNGDSDKLNFVLGSELYHNNDEFWQSFVEISKHTTMGRISRSITIMGRKEGESVDFAKLLYAPMQVADIFAQGINLTHSGIDQRKAHVIAIEVAKKLKIKPLVYKKESYKPIAVHHPLLLGLQQPPIWPIAPDKVKDVLSAMKMSKSIPKSAVFIHDTPEEIKNKLKSAFCPEKDTNYNPVLDWAKYLVFRDEKSALKIERPTKFGGDITFNSYSELEDAFSKGNLHPMDLKNGVAEYLIRLLEPARKHFNTPRVKKMKEELDNLKITR